MEGSPLPEYRYIQTPSKKTPTSRACRWAWTTCTPSIPGCTGSRTPRRGYPTTREELLSYDVIICSDIARGAFTPEQLEWTVELVSKRGGGFAMIGGNTQLRLRRVGPDGLGRPDPRRHERARRRETRNSRVTRVQGRSFPPDAIDHPIWRIVDDPERNREILARMPMFTGTNLI